MTAQRLERPLRRPPAPQRAHGPQRQAAAGGKRAERRRRDVQGLRAVAVSLVVAYHAGLPVPGGFTGVDLFFVISGFVITSVLAAELESSGRIDLPRFYVRRARRLLPALATMLVPVLLFAAFLSPTAIQDVTALTGVAASFFAANAYLLTVGTDYFAPAVEQNPLLHTWTLGVEEQFYVVFPLLLLVAWRLRAGRAGRRSALAALAVASSASFLLFASVSAGVLLANPGTGETAFFSSPARAWEFGAGALLALAVPWLARLSPWAGRALGLLGLAAIALAAGSSHVPNEAQTFLIPVLGACALIAAGTGNAPFATRLLGTRPAVWVGDLSYSWYLWHWPLIVFASALWPSVGWVAVGAAAFSLLPAWLSLRFVENPIRFGRRAPGRRFALVAAACIVVPVAASVGLLGIKSALAAHPAMKSWQHSQEHHADITQGCDHPTALTDRGDGRCTWQVPGATGTIVLLGDSNAGHFTEPVVQAARRARLDLTVATFPGCPFLDVDIGGQAGAERRRMCLRSTREAHAELVRLRPNLVILAARSDKYIENPEYELGDGAGRMTGAPDAKARIWEAGLARTLERLRRAGVPVLVVHPVPVFPYSTESCATLRIILTGCSTSTPLAEVEKRLHRARRAEDRAVAAVTGAATIDFTEGLCGEERCSTARGNTVLYRDGEHLSIEGALPLSDSFYDAIVTRARG
ncbi:MAG TPA: acyltransferase family protein [Gaiellaceae bacterium]|nr:acyltransferase family protein [Gaiellaceae bacterium]